MDHFYDNSLQTGLMSDIAIYLEVLGEHIVLLGNQVRQILRSLYEDQKTDRVSLLGLGRRQEQDCRQALPGKPASRLPLG